MRRCVLVAGGLACLALAHAPHPRLLLNTTASVPVGLYSLSPPGPLQVGDLVVVRPDPMLADFLHEGGWLPKGVPLVKPIAAASGQTVCRHSQTLEIDGRPAARALVVDGHGRALPTWRGCHTLAQGQVLLLAPALGSLDGRYFGVTDQAQIVARARPLVVVAPEAQQ
jgi:conjugative transfer signal peptidase TraF